MATGRLSASMDALGSQLDGMSPRDRRLLLGLGAGLALGLVAGTWWLLAGVLEDRASRVREAKLNLETVYEMQAEFAEASKRLQASESRLRSHSATPVTAYVEKLAAEHGLSDKLRSVNARGNPESVGNLEQANYTVDFQKAPLDALVGFLHELESGGYPIQVQEANFKASGKPGERVLDLKLDVLAIRLADGSEP